MKDRTPDQHPLFQTARLRVRRWFASDVEPLYRVYADPEGARWVDDGQPITRSECEHWMVVTERNYAQRGYGMFAVDELAGGATVGFVGLVHPADQPEVEIKYSFLRSRWGRGYASEIVAATLDYAEKMLGIDRVIATVAPQNAASQRVLRKAGMHLVDELEEDDGTSTLLFEWSAGSKIDGAFREEL